MKRMWLGWLGIGSLILSMAGSELATAVRAEEPDIFDVQSEAPNPDLEALKKELSALKDADDQSEAERRDAEKLFDDATVALDSDPMSSEKQTKKIEALKSLRLAEQKSHLAYENWQQKQRQVELQQMQLELFESLKVSIQTAVREAYTNGAAGGAVGAVGASAPKDPTGVVPGRVVHLLVYSNADDGQINGIGQGAGANGQFVVELFRSTFGDRLRLVANKTQFDQTSILREINAVQSDSNDAIICYISTHGVFDNRRHYLSASGTNRANMDRGVLFGAILRRDAGLRVMITDACGSFPGQAVAAAAVAAAARPRYWPLWDLVLKTNTTVNVNAATEGEFALYRIQPLNAQRATYGGIFTREFVRNAVELNLKTPSWDEFFQRVGDSADDQSLPVNNQMMRQPRPCKIRVDGSFERQL